MEEKNFRSKWENYLTKYDIESVDKDALLSYYKESISCGRLDSLKNYSEVELLTRLGLFENGYLTNAGFYLFSNKKPVVLKMATYVTDARINFSDIRRVEDNIYNLIRCTNAYIKEKMNLRVEMGEGTSRIEILEVPVLAIREIIVNSFAHANYRGVTEHEIDITPTQIKIYNPGEFPINLKPEMFVTASRKSHPRNKVILTTLYKCKDIEIFSSGFKKVFSLCEASNVKFDYETSEDGFSFVFYRPNAINKTPLVAETILRTSDYKVLNVLRDNPNLTREQIASLICMDKRTVQRKLNTLVANGFIIRIGSKKTGYWKILN